MKRPVAAPIHCDAHSSLIMSAHGGASGDADFTPALVTDVVAVPGSDAVLMRRHSVGSARNSRSSFDFRADMHDGDDGPSKDADRRQLLAGSGGAFDGTGGDYAALLRRISWRVLPVPMLMNMLSFMDRANLSNAHGTITKDLGLSDTQFGVAASIFFAAYIAFEIPSNMMLEHVETRKWMSLIMVVWGIVCVCTVFVRGFGGLMIARFCLGAAEAGLFPGLILYFARWFTKAELSRRYAIFYTSQTMSNVLGGLLSYPVLHMDGLLHLHGWQWLFIVEGVPTILFGSVVWMLLPERPASVTWLSAEEKVYWEARIEAAKTTSSPTSHGRVSLAQLRGTICRKRMWLLAGLSFSVILPLYCLAFYLPTIISDFGFDPIVSNLVSTIPYAFATAAMYANASHADRTGDHAVHVVVANCVAALGFLLLGVSFSTGWGGKIGRLVMACVAATGTWSAVPVVLAWQSIATVGNLPIGYAFVISITNFSGLIGPSAVGFFKDLTGSHALGMLLLVGSVAAASAFALLLRRAIAFDEARGRGDGPLLGDGPLDTLELNRLSHDALSMNGAVSDGDEVLYEWKSAAGDEGEVGMGEADGADGRDEKGHGFVARVLRGGRRQRHGYARLSTEALDDDADSLAE